MSLQSFHYCFFNDLKLEKVLTFCIICISISDWIIEICNVVDQRWLRKWQTIQQVNTFVVGRCQVRLLCGKFKFLIDSIAYRRWSRYVWDEEEIRRKRKMKIVEIFLPHMSENAQMKNENFSDINMGDESDLIERKVERLLKVFWPRRQKSPSWF